MKKTIIFDFDGTLVDSLGLKGEVFAKLFESYGPDIQREIMAFHDHNPGLSRFDKFKEFYKRLKKPYSEEEGERLSALFDSIYSDSLPHIKLFPGVREFLEKNKEKSAFYIASASRYNEISSVLEKHGLREYFVDIYGYPHKKADVVKQLIRNGVLPEDILFIGDSVEDFLAARDAGVDFKGVGNGWDLSLGVSVVSFEKDFIY